MTESRPGKRPGRTLTIVAILLARITKVVSSNTNHSKVRVLVRVTEIVAVIRIKKPDHPTCVALPQLKRDNEREKKNEVEKG